MGGKQKAPPLGGLAAALRKAGLVTKEQTERVEEEKLGRKESRGTETALESSGSYGEQVASVNVRFAERLRKEPDLAASLTGERTQAVVVIEGSRATHAEIQAAERALGFMLPPSFAAFLLEMGSVSFLNPWHDATTPVGRLVTASASLDADAALTVERFIQAAGREGVTVDPSAPRQLLHVCDEKGGDAVFALCSKRDAAGEAPVFTRFHDEPDVLYHPADSFRQWFSERLLLLEDELQDGLTQKPPR